MHPFTRLARLHIASYFTQSVSRKHSSNREWLGGIWSYIIGVIRFVCEHLKRHKFDVRIFIGVSLLLYDEEHWCLQQPRKTSSDYGS